MFDGTDPVADAYGGDVPMVMEAMDAGVLLIEAYGRRERGEAMGISLDEERAALLVSAVGADVQALKAAVPAPAGADRLADVARRPADKLRHAGQRAASLIRFDAAHGGGRAVPGAASELADVAERVDAGAADPEEVLLYVRAEWAVRNG